MPETWFGLIFLTWSLCDMATVLLVSFSMPQLNDAITAVDAPGDDGLTRQFFSEFWDMLQAPLLRRLQQIFDSGFMSPSLCSGLISLIRKGDDSTSLRQWRPITLLSSIYKILARLISARLCPFMQDLIHGSQTAFI